MTINRFPPEAKRYVGRIWIAAAVYIAPLVLRIILPDSISKQAAWHFALLILPTIGMIGFFWAMHRLLAEMSDEYQRQVMAEIYQLASWLTLSITAVIGFLQNDKVLPLIELFVVPMLFFFCFGLASIWVRWRKNACAYEKE